MLTPVRTLALVIAAGAILSGCVTHRVKVQPSEAVLAARAHRDVDPVAACSATPLSQVSPVLVGFAYGETELGDLTAPKLVAPVAWLACHPDVAVVIKPDADNHGGEDLQRQVATKRAASVRSYLTSHGIASGRIRTLAFGAAEPPGDHLLIEAAGRRW